MRFTATEELYKFHCRWLFPRRELIFIHPETQAKIVLRVPERRVISFETRDYRREPYWRLKDSLRDRGLRLRGNPKKKQIVRVLNKWDQTWSNTTPSTVKPPIFDRVTISCKGEPHSLEIHSVHENTSTVQESSSVQAFESPLVVQSNPTEVAPILSPPAYNTRYQTRLRRWS